jgi:hypothetical protein
VSFEREIAVVEREREKEGPIHFGTFGGVGVLLLLCGVFSWSALGASWAATLLGLGLGLMRIGVQGRVKEYETVTKKAVVSITGAGIKAVGRPLVRKESIKDAYYQPRPGAKASVRCVDDRDAVLFEAEVESEDEAREILRALGRDVTQGRSTFSASAPMFTGAGGGFQAFAVMIGLVIGAVAVPGYFKVLPIMALAAFATALTTQQKVEIGVDGVLISWFSRKRFVRYDAIEKVTKGPYHLALVLKDGTTIRLSTTSNTAHQGKLRRDALVARLAEARASYDGASASRAIVQAVARGDRDVAAWRDALARIHEQGYRETAAREEDLWRVVEDTSAPEDARAGAAVALRRGDGAAPRLRIAAEAVASPRLRIALEKAADPEAEDEALDDSLTAFEREA